MSSRHIGNTMEAMAVPGVPPPARVVNPCPGPVTLRRCYLAPGQMFVSREPAEVTTIIGSCVAVCLFDTEHHGGGVIHYVLPSGPTERGARAGRFGDSAFEALVSELLSFCCSLRSLRAKVYGGACMIDAFRDRDDHLGSRNVAIGLALLRDAGIPVLHKDTGGARGRKMVFQTHDGSSAIHLL